MVADALLLKDMIAGFVVVVRERSTTHGDLQHLLDSVKLADSTVLGLIEVGCTYDSKRRKVITTTSIINPNFVLWHKTTHSQ